MATIVEDNPFASGGRSFEESSVIKNPAATAKTTPHHTGFFAAATLRGDGALHTTSRSAFLDLGAYDVINAGTVTASSHRSFDSALAVGSGVTATLRQALNVQEATGAGTVLWSGSISLPAVAGESKWCGMSNLWLVGTAATVIERCVCDPKLKRFL